MATQARRKEPPTPSPQLVEMAWDPITRIVGSLGIYTKLDFQQRKVVECHSTSSIFRGYSIFMQGKDPRDSHFITSRICGICGDNHATCSVYAQKSGKVSVCQPSTGIPRVSSSSDVAATSRSDLTPEETTSTRVSESARRSADTSGGVGQPR